MRKSTMGTRRWVVVALLGAPAFLLGILLLPTALRALLPVQPAAVTREPVELHPAGDFSHPTAGFPMPERVGPFQRVEVTQYDEEGRDVSAGYNAEAVGRLSMPIIATLYVYPNDEGHDLDRGFGRLVRGIRGQHDGSKLEFKKNVVLADGRFVGRYAVFAFEEPWGAATEDSHLRSYLVLYQWQGWWVKWRATTPAPVDRERMRAIVDLTETLLPSDGRAAEGVT